MNTLLLTRSIEGVTVHVVEEDDGSGWVKVIDDRGGKGLVPASYLEVAGVKSLGPSGSSGEPQGSGHFGKYPSTVGPDRVTSVSTCQCEWCMIMKRRVLTSSAFEKERCLNFLLGHMGVRTTPTDGGKVRISKLPSI